MHTKTISKIFRIIIFSTLITIFLLFSGLNNYTIYASESALVGAIVPGKVNNNGVILINGSPNNSENSTTTNLNSAVNQTKLPQNGISEDALDMEKNIILKTIENGIDFLLPRTGGQSIVIGFSFILCILGLFICISSFWKKN